MPAKFFRAAKTVVLRIGMISSEARANSELMVSVLSVVYFVKRSWMTDPLSLQCTSVKFSSDVKVVSGSNRSSSYHCPRPLVSNDERDVNDRRSIHRCRERVSSQPDHILSDSRVFKI